VTHTQIHNVITANSAVIDDDIPSPESHTVPLLCREFDVNLE